MLPRALRFALHFLLALVPLVGLYVAFVGAYQELVIGFANAGLRLLSPLLEIQVAPDGGWHTYQIEGGLRVPLYGMRHAAVALLFGNLVVLPALLVATPVPIARRLRLVALGLAVLFVLHVASAMVLVHTHRCPDALLCQWLRSIVKVGAQLFTVAAWALLTWSYWLRESRPAS